MQYSAAVRDRFRTVVVAGTGIATVAALSATGWLTGATARDYDAAQARKAAAQEARQRAVRAWQRATRAQAAATARPRVVLRERPHRTHVTLRYVDSVPGSSAVGPGGAVSAPASVPAPAAAPAPATNAAPPPPAPAPPPPPPPPAPSSGS